MKWTPSEIKRLSPILQQVRMDLEPIEDKRVVVLCSAGGDVAISLAEKMRQGRVIGLELSKDLLEAAKISANRKGLTHLVEFKAAEKTCIPLPDETFDGLVSEFIVFPTPVPTEIGQREMARVLRPGGMIVLTDIIATISIPQPVRNDLHAIGLDYLCEGTEDDFRNWMTEAGLANIKVIDFTPVVRRVWEDRQSRDQMLEHRKGYSHLLEYPAFALGRTIFYIYVTGEKV